MQLGSSGTSYNVTLNLTGHILMGLGIATSLLLYMFLNGMDNAGYGYGHQSSGYNSYDRALRTKVKRIYKHHIYRPLQLIIQAEIKLSYGME